MGHLNDQKILQDGSFFAVLYLRHGYSTSAGVIDAMRRRLGILRKPSLRIPNCTQEQADEAPHSPSNIYIGNSLHVLHLDYSYSRLPCLFTSFHHISHPHHNCYFKHTSYRRLPRKIRLFEHTIQLFIMTPLHTKTENRVN
jgi:hypothetical protein